jgi:hypothetical protein
MIFDYQMDNRLSCQGIVKNLVSYTVNIVEQIFKIRNPLLTTNLSVAKLMPSHHFAWQIMCPFFCNLRDGARKLQKKNTHYRLAGS